MGGGPDWGINRIHLGSCTNHLSTSKPSLQSKEGYFVTMKILFIGGTGNISRAASRLALQQGHELWLLHRHALHCTEYDKDLFGAQEILCDIYDESCANNMLQSHRFAAVVNWIAFSAEDVERDLRLFSDRTAHYVFISSASVYQKPPLSRIITERTPLGNPYWQYARDKIRAEAVCREAMAMGFPVTIVRPSLTYDTVLPFPLGAWKEWTLVDRIKRGLPIPVHGDGTQPWTITHSDDFAQGFLPLLGSAQAQGEDFHITSEEHPTWDQMYQWLAEACGTKAIIKHCNVEQMVKVIPDLTDSLLGDKAWPLIFDNRKLRRIVPTFSPRVSFQEGIQRTVRWFESDIVRQQINPKSNESMDAIIKHFSSN